MTEDEEETVFTEEDSFLIEDDETFEELLLDCLLLLDTSWLSPLWMTELLLRVTLDDDDFLMLELDGDPGTSTGSVT